MTRYATILSLCISLIALSVNADVVHSTDFEADGASQGAVFGVGPASMGFTDAGGDLVGFSMNNNSESSGLALGLGTGNPNSGSYHYVVDAGQTVAGPGWGGSWSGISTINGATSGGFVDQSTALANGGNYINYTPGATFTVSAGIATDSADPLSGGASGAVRLEFYSKVDADGDGVQDLDGNGNPVTSELLPRVGGNGFDASSLTTNYQTSTATYTLTAADVAMGLGIDRVVGVMGTDGHTMGATDGLIVYDDFLFEVNSANVVNVVPEPGSISLLIAGFLSLCGMVRRKRS